MEALTVKQAIRILTIIMGFLAIGGFVVIYTTEILKAWPHPHSSKVETGVNGNVTDITHANDQQIDDPYSYVATSLASLVGAVVAVMFGRPAPGASKTLDWASILSVVYAYVYVLMGVAALITWVVHPLAPVLVKTLALVFLGLLIPVVTSFLKPGGFASFLSGTAQLSSLV
jgi:hypothetical protein